MVQVPVPCPLLRDHELSCASQTTAVFLPFSGCKIFSTTVGTTLTINTCGDNASGITGSLATREESTKTDVHQGVGGAEDADRG